MDASTLLYLAVLFVVGSFLGWVFEYALNLQPSWNLETPCLPFLFVYGIGLVGVYLLHPYIKDYHIAIRALIYALLLVFLEMAVGVVSTMWHGGKKTWQYDSDGAQISVGATAAWTVLALISERVMFPT